MSDPEIYRDDRGDDEVDELQRQLERDGLFTHTALSALAVRINELAAFLHGAIDVLIKNGVVTESAIEAAAASVNSELEARKELAHAGVLLRKDPPDKQPAVVDCAARMHVCKAICCKLDFALTAEEVEGGAIRWDLGQPYYIRHGRDGGCVHQNRDGSCGVYASRPVICRTYSCADDSRIWSNFEAMELNHEWIEQHLGGTGPRLVRSWMSPEPLEPPARPSDED
jgi:Fe-S-cluster containining protein